MGKKRLDFDIDPLGPPEEDEDDPWDIKKEIPARLPPKSEDFAKRKNNARKRSRRVSRRLADEGRL